jgi:hypothetical protein
MGAGAALNCLLHASIEVLAIGAWWLKRDARMGLEGQRLGAPVHLKVTVGIGHQRHAGAA